MNRLLVFLACTLWPLAASAEPVTSILIGIGSAVTAGAAGGTTAGVIGGLTVASTAATTGLGIAQATGAFDPKAPKSPEFGSPSASAAALKDRKMRSATAARNRNIFGGRALGASPSGTQTALFGPGGEAQ